MTIVLFRVADAETSGLNRSEGSEVVEWGWTDVIFNTVTKAVSIGEPSFILFCPERGMPPEASAVHHLTMRHLAEHPVHSDHDARLLLTEGKPDFIVSHNWDMEAQWLTPELLGDVKPICTMKGARRAWPDAPNFKNGTLRYWLNIDLAEDRALPAHRAGPDTYVTAHILERLLQEVTVNELVQWTRLPAHLPTCPLFKHKGQAWSEIPHDYLSWIKRTADMGEDVRYAAEQEIERRKMP